MFTWSSLIIGSPPVVRIAGQNKKAFCPFAGAKHLCFQPEHDYTHFPAFVKCFFAWPCWKAGQGRGFQPVLEAGSRRLRPFRPPDPCRNLVLLPKNGRRQGGKTLHSAKFWEPGPLRPPGSLGPPAAGPPCRQGSPEEPL